MGNRAHNSADSGVRCVAADGAVSVRALVATALVQEAARRHGTSPVATAALGRALQGASLLAAGKKDGETLQIQLRGDGPLGTVTVIGDHRGRTRGFAAEPRVDLPSRAGKLDVGAAVGRGHLAVVRYHPSWREPYTGIVPLASGEVAEDIARYLADSEQTAAALALGVFVAADWSVEAAGGYLVEALPGADAAVLERVEANVAALPNPSALVRAGQTAEEIARAVLAGLSPEVLEHFAPCFHCPCDRERVTRAALLLGGAELRAMRDRREPIEVRCEFCAEPYALDAEDVLADLHEA